MNIMAMEMDANTSVENPPEKLFELSMIKTMCRGDQEMVNTMVEVFIDLMPQSMEELRSAYRDNDITGIRNTAHKMKSSLAYYGISQIEKDIQHIETMAEEGTAIIELETKIDSVHEMVTKVIHKMKQEFMKY